MPAPSPAADAPTLPSLQHAYPGLPRLTEAQLYQRREGVFLVLAGLFLGTLTMLNLLGITRFIKLGEITLSGGTPDAWTLTFAVAVGVLPYPITFLCTDFISELYGRKRASLVVWVGFVLNLWVVLVLWVGGVLPGYEPADEPRSGVFFDVQKLAFGAVAASMAAYLVAQFVDVYVFHFWKTVTKNKHLWLRNNGSTLVSQLVDTTAVILITHFYAQALPAPPEGQRLWPFLLTLIATGYVFKAACALIDTVPFYLGAPRLARYLRLAPPDHPPAVAGAAAVQAGVG